MGKVFSVGMASLSLGLSLALVTSGAVVARSAHEIDPSEGVIVAARLGIIGDEDEDGEDDGTLKLPLTDNDGTDSDGIDTPTPTDNDGTDSDGFDTPTPTDNDGTDSDGIDTPTPTDNDGTDSDGIDTLKPTDNDGTDSDGVNTPDTNVLQAVPSMEFDGQAIVSFANTAVAHDSSSLGSVVTAEQNGASATYANAQLARAEASQVFDADDSYRVLTSYGSGTEIDLADYLTSATPGSTFSLKSCDGFSSDYYDSAAVENGKLVLTPNTQGHVHGANTQSETVCTVTATVDGVSQDREFSLYTVSDRTPPPLTPSSISLVEARSGELEV